MVFKFCVMFISVVSLQLCSCQRRVVNGGVSAEGRQFMVYFVNSKYSDVQLPGWLCGGALISETQIITAASCLTKVKYMYAIAGYRKYVSSEEIDIDKCTRERKQKVTEIIVPAAFYSTKQDSDERLKYDVGLATVEKPYNFTDTSYYVICSYAPDKTYINYDVRYETPSTEASIFGWGGNGKRKTDEVKDLNSEYMHEAKTVVTNASFCARYVTEALKPIVYSSLLCAFGSGYISRENQNKAEDSLYDDCLLRRFNINDPNAGYCKEFFEKVQEANETVSNEMFSRRKNMEEYSDAGGICENDHGGPLVTWFGSAEVIVGIALTSIKTISRYMCQGPYIYFALAKMGALVRCLSVKNTDALALCKQLSYEAKKTIIDWPSISLEKSTVKTRKTTTLTTSGTKRTWIPKRQIGRKLNRTRNRTSKLSAKVTSKRMLRQTKQLIRKPGVNGRKPKIVRPQRLTNNMRPVKDII